MKFYQCFEVSAKDIPDNIFSGLLAMSTGSLIKGSFNTCIKIEATASDGAKPKLIEQAIAYCEKNGISWSERGLFRHYRYEIHRNYELQDLTSAKLLHLSRGNLIQLKSERDEQGRLLMDASKARAGRKIGRIEPNWIIIPESVRKIIADGNFKGLEFGEVALRGTSARASTEPFWELKSSLTLPKIANTDRFVSVNSVPFDGDYTKMVWIKDPPYRSGEIHYRERDLKALGEFDVARTLEKYKEPHPALVVSQRFFQHCLKNKIPLAVEPVRIDTE